MQKRVLYWNFRFLSRKDDPLSSNFSASQNRDSGYSVVLLHQTINKLPLQQINRLREVSDADVFCEGRMLALHG